MKKLFTKFISIFVLSFLITSPVIAEDAVVTFVKGKVEVLKGDSWVSLNVGDSLKQSDTVSTGFQSEAKIKMNGSLMALGALTRITLDQLAIGGKNEKVDVYLSTGAVRSKVTHTDDTRISYSVRSPVAVASVRGTDFFMTEKGDISCFEGAIAVSANDGSRNIPTDTSELVIIGEEEEGENEGDSETPEGDNTPAKPTTDPNEISSDAPDNSVVVGANQKTTFSKSGEPEKPADTAKKNVNKVKDTVSTAADKEAVTSGGSTVTETTTNVDTTPKTGSIEVTIEFEAAE